MSEIGILARMIGFLGVITVFAGLLFQVGGPPGLPSLENGPTLDNPFDHGVTYTFGLSDPGAGYGPGGDYIWGTTGDAYGCSDAEFWNCVIDPAGPDRNATYVSVNGPLVLNTTGWPQAGKVRYGTVTLSCRSNGTGAKDGLMAALLNSWLPSTGGVSTGYLQNVGENVYCRPGLQFQTTVLHLDLIYGSPTPTDLSANPHCCNLQLEIFGTYGSSATVEISSVTITAFIADASSCSGGDFFSNIGCTLADGFKFITNLGLLFVNIGILIFSWIVFIGSFIGGVVADLLWFYSIPGMPPIFQALVDVIVTVMAFVLVYTVARLIRGSGPV